ncbi:GNAT family N-acetyltransferase [Nocardia arizonensis]|uniref:GNAT family N-acetyltransferase n=1 Tax=Nocardia arizonensis TaxID=1141647 RepID=UPI0006D207D0|nr:GNAT family N-acetyltransferase [Nocardia arizonensis]
MADENKVVNNPEQHRYEVFHGGALAGFTEYVERDDVTDFVHTEIDDAFAGKGLAKVLAKGALDDVIARGRVIEAHCSFIRSYLDKNPDYDGHVLGKGVRR